VPVHVVWASRSELMCVLPASPSPFVLTKTATLQPEALARLVVGGSGGRFDYAACRRSFSALTSSLSLNNAPQPNACSTARARGSRPRRASHL
jgi:hypothetical protein